MNKLDIKQLTNGATLTDTIAVCTAASTRLTSKGSKYLAATLSDGRNTIDAKFWDYNDDAIAVDNVYIFNATVGEYAGKPQLTLTDIKPVADSAAAAMKAAFLPTRGYNIDEAWKKIEYAVDTLTGTPFFPFVDELIIKRKEEWCNATAAIKMHHVQAGGLVQHTSEVYMNCYHICLANDATSGYVNAGLITAGALLHDLGKLQTYTTNAMSFSMTLEGYIHDHIARGFKMLMESESAKVLPDIASLLGHIILSHHGCPEFGSSVKPACLEAYIVHIADKLSSDIDAYTKALEDAPVNIDPTFAAPYNDAFNRTCLKYSYIQDTVLKNSNVERRPISDALIIHR